MSLKFGLLFPFRNPDFARAPWEWIYQSHLDLAVDADRLGYDHIWLTEHHFVDDGYSPSLLPIGAAIAARTRRIRIGTFVLLLPLHDPIRVAEDAATVDLISHGRLDLGFGLGYRPGEFEGFGVSRRERGARLQEGARLIQRLFCERDLSFDGRFSKLKGVTLTPPPLQQPHPPIWLAARAQRAIDRAAEYGFHLAAVGAPDFHKMYDDALRQRGRKPEDYSIAQLRAVYLAESREAAWQAAAQPLSHMANCYAQWFAEANDMVGDDAALGTVPTAEAMMNDQAMNFFGERAIVGTPEDAIREIEDYRSRGRLTHLVMAMVLPGLAPNLARSSMELFAREVAPHFKD